MARLLQGMHGSERESRPHPEPPWPTRRAVALARSRRFNWRQQRVSRRLTHDAQQNPDLATPDDSR